MTRHWLGFFTSTSPLSSEALTSEDATEPAIEETIVASYATLIDAELARGRLAAEGVAARLLDEFTIGVAAHLSVAIGGVKLVVPLEHEELARELLEDRGVEEPA